MAAAISLPYAPHASTHSMAGWVVRELSAESLTTASGSSQNAIATGASRISDPLPALIPSTVARYGSPLISNCSTAVLVRLPMSKHSPVLLRYPSRYQWTNRASWSRGS